MLTRLLAFFFHHLYHGLANFYDWVSWTVSFGQWNAWIKLTLTEISGTRILELGFGPGHLQRAIADLGLDSVAIDESPQMARLARRRLIQRGQYRGQLARAVAQAMPFRGESFDSIVATFPTRYILDARTLSEAHRVLRGTGRLIVLPAAWPRSRLLNWLYRVTGESPLEAQSQFLKEWTGPFEQAGFDTTQKIIELRSGRLLLILATKR